MAESIARAATAPLRAPASGYAPIRDYAIVGDCHGAALISRQGGVDWCCLGRFDADPMLFRLLDAKRGGFLAVRPTEPFRVARRYINATNVLESVFTTASGTVAVTDFMPVGRRPGAGAHDYTDLSAPCWLVRLIDGRAGRVGLTVELRLSGGLDQPAIAHTVASGRVVTRAGTLYADFDFARHGDGARAEIEIAAGDKRTLLLAHAPGLEASALARARTLLPVTQAFWQEWAAYCRYGGPYGAEVRRSALVLKLLTYAPSGALVAAATTSLPECIGGGRNWDYRYCWVRDASFALYALATLGYGGEARRFSDFLRARCAEDEPHLRILYGIDPSADLAEREHAGLEGYRASRPVRTGNAAHEQRQLDIHGAVLDWALVYDALGGSLDRRDRAILEHFVEAAARAWREPDHGIWEKRDAPRHHVHGKAMAWVAADRALRLFGHRARWAELRETIARDIRAHGIDPRRGALAGVYGGDRADAALLRLPLLGFPIDRALLRRTVAAIENDLRRGDFVYRYTGEDGLAGREGAFLACGFWLVDALLYLERFEDACRLFERACASANDIGLLAEEIDPDSGAFLGNYPQALTHLALIESANNLELYARGGIDAIAGTDADRARRSVGALFGWRGLWAAWRRSRRVHRVFASRRSTLRL